MCLGSVGELAFRRPLGGVGVETAQRMQEGNKEGSMPVTK